MAVTSSSFPALRPQPEHGRPDRRRGARAGRAQHRLPRRGPAVADPPAGGEVGGVPPWARWSLPGAAVVLSSGVVVAAAFSLSFWAGPVADDFCYAAMRLTWPQFVAERYQNWSGRWLVMGLYAIIWPRVDITSGAYPALLAVLWAGLLASFFVLVRLVWGTGPGPGQGGGGRAGPGRALPERDAVSRRVHVLAGRGRPVHAGDIAVHLRSRLARAGRDVPARALAVPRVECPGCLPRRGRDGTQRDRGADAASGAARHRSAGTRRGYAVRRMLENGRSRRGAGVVW